MSDDAGVRAALVLIVLWAAGCSDVECHSDTDCAGLVCREDKCVAGAGRADPQPHEDRTEGWSDPVGSGLAFVMDSLAIADQGRGFDLDGLCRGEGDCIDNSLYQLGQLGNDQIRQGLLGGETLALFELAGLDEPFFGQDASVTLKLYGAQDADEPYFPANNFQIPPGQQTCCEFLVEAEWTQAQQESQARVRVRAEIEAHEIRAAGSTGALVLPTPTSSYHGAELAFSSIQFQATMSPDLDRLDDIVMGLVVPIHSLAGIDNPYCKTLNQLCPRLVPDGTLIDLMATIQLPDIDLDGDGLEWLEVGVSGRIEHCWDGCDDLRFCRARPVEPVFEGEPWSCALSPRMADGYSVTLTASGVRARVLGISD